MTLRIADTKLHNNNFCDSVGQWSDMIMIQLVLLLLYVCTTTTYFFSHSNVDVCRAHCWKTSWPKRWRKVSEWAVHGCWLFVIGCLTRECVRWVFRATNHISSNVQVWSEQWWLRHIREASHTVMDGIQWSGQVTVSGSELSLSALGPYSVQVSVWELNIWTSVSQL